MKLPKLHLRDLFWLVLVCGMGCGWWLEFRRRSELQRKEDMMVDNSNRSEINAAVERWYFNNFKWPADDLSDIGPDRNYFPDGLPTNPLDGSAYTLDPIIHRVQ